MSASAAPVPAAAPARPALSWASRFRGAAYLGWQIESNWADPLTFAVYTVLRPVGTALILSAMYWAVAGQAARPEAFAAFYLGNAFHEYVVRVLVGMGWIIVEEREEYETLRYVFASPIGLLTYLAGRSVTKFALASVSVTLLLVLGWWLLGLRWDWMKLPWPQLLTAFVLGLAATLSLGFLVAGWALLLPRAAINLNEGVGISLYLLCGVIFPVELLPPVIRHVALALPFTYWYEAMRRFLIGRGASQMLAGWSDGALLGALAATTALMAVVGWAGFRALEHRARQLGRLDHSTLF